MPLQSCRLPCFCWRSHSGATGIQEETPSLRKPILILRTVTERPEVVEAGFGRLVGTDPDVVVGTANQLLRDAGFPDGRGLPPIEILYNTLEGHRAIAEAIQEMWRKHLGADTRLLNQEWKVYIDTQRNLNYDLSRGGWTADYPDPYTFLGTFRGDGGNNQTGWKHPDYDRLLDASEAAATPEKRFALLARAEAILVEECPIIPLYFYTQ